MALARSEDNPKGFNNDIITITGLNTSPTATDSGIVFAEKKHMMFLKFVLLSMLVNYFYRQRNQPY
jgi:hypothetical protein